jgi:hypothetical protein
MSDLTRDQIRKMAEELEKSAARADCLTCECLQGLLTQLEMDRPGKVSDLTSRLKVSDERMHGCLGCDPCQPGALFAEYLRSGINDC